MNDWYTKKFCWWGTSVIESRGARPGWMSDLETSRKDEVCDTN